MRIDKALLTQVVEAAKLSTAQLDTISQRTLGTALSSVSTASMPAQQAADLLTYAVQYGLEAEFAAAVLYTGADRPGLLNLLLGDETMVNNQTEEQHGISVNALDIVKLDNRVGRLEDKYVALERKVDAFLQRTPLNWNIVGWGVALAIVIGIVMWAMATVN